MHYGPAWLSSGFPISEDLPLVKKRHHPPDILLSNSQRAIGAVDDARPDRWGEKVIRFMDKQNRLLLMEYLYFAGDERFGALGVSTSAFEYLPRHTNPLPVLVDAQHFSEVAQRVQAAEPLGVLEANMVAGGGSPMGGAKSKALGTVEARIRSLSSVTINPLMHPWPSKLL